MAISGNYDASHHRESYETTEQPPTAQVPREVRGELVEYDARTAREMGQGLARPTAYHDDGRIGRDQQQRVYEAHVVGEEEEEEVNWALVPSIPQPLGYLGFDAHEYEEKK